MFDATRCLRNVVVNIVMGMILSGAALSTTAAAPAAPQVTAEQKQKLEEAKQLNAQVLKLIKEEKTKDAIPIARQALAIRQEILGNGHADTATSLHNLGRVLKAQGDLAAARPYYEQALAIRQKVQGNEHSETASELNSLGVLLLDQRDYAAARPYLEQALKIRQKVSGNMHADTATAFKNLGLLFRALGDDAAARSNYEEALKINQKIHGDEHRSLIDQLNKLAAICEHQHDFAAARSYYERALKIRKKELGEEHADTVKSLNNLGSLLTSQGDYTAARPYYEEALKIRQKVLGEEHKDTTVSLNSLGYLLKSQGNYAAARPYYEQALKIRQKTLGEEHKDTATSLNLLGMLLEAQGNYSAAQPYLEQALKIRQKVLGDEHTDTAMSLSNMGLLLEAQGNYAAARPYFEQALTIKKKLLGDEHADVALSLSNLGGLSRAQGDYAAARQYYEQALKIRRKALGDAHKDTATSFSTLGLLFLSQGDYAAARPYFEQGLKIRQKALGNEHRDTATSLIHLGELFEAQGDYTAARPYLEQALKIRQKVLGDEHPTTATSLSSLGSLLSAKRDYAGARVYYEQALNIRQKVLGDEHPNTALSLSHLGLCLYHQGDLAAARPYMEQALKIRQKVLGSEHIDTAASLNNLGLLSAKQGDYEAARDYYQQSIKICEKVFGDDHPSTAKTIGNLILLEAAAGNWTEVAQLIEQRRHGTRRHIARVLPGLSEKEQRIFLQSKDKASLYIALSAGFERREDPDFAARSAGWLLNGKGVGHAALAERTLLTRNLDDEPKLTALVQDLLETRKKLAMLTLSVLESGKETTRREALAKLADAEVRLSRQVTEASGRPADADPWVELNRMRKVLPKDGVLIDIARFQPYDFQAKQKQDKYRPARYVAWVIPAEGKGDVQIVDLGPADIIEAAIEAARKTIQAATNDNGLIKQKGEIAADKQSAEVLQKVADLVWKPLAEKLGGAKQVILSPDGALWLVPWAALPIAEDKVLIEACPLRYVVSGRDVLHSNAAKLTHSVPAIFADPDFSLPADKVRQTIRTALPKRKINDGDETRSLMSKNSLPLVARLPNTAAEAELIAPNISRLTKEKPKTYTGHEALESIFKTIQRPPLLVLSTHGFFLADQEVKHDENASDASETKATLTTVDGKQIENPLLRCGLLLAGCNSQQSNDGDDGILTGMEIVGVDLRGTDLVVLSACETGVGKIRNGEGVAGLRQAFQLAGAKSVVATLWQVPDRDSMIIMNDFFQNLADGQSKTDALRNAQLKRIQTRRDKNGAAHPFFWAAWTLTGE